MTSKKAKSTEKKGVAAKPVLTVASFRRACRRLGAAFGEALVSQESVGHSARKYKNGVSLARFWVGLDSGNRRNAMSEADGDIITRFLAQVFYLDFHTKNQVIGTEEARRRARYPESFIDDPADEKGAVELDGGVKDTSAADDGDEGDKNDEGDEGDENDEGDKVEVEEELDEDTQAWKEMQHDYVAWAVEMTDSELEKLIGWVNTFESESVTSRGKK